ncbi:ABC transporter permease [Roseococcus sp. SYP-B2431]|uniref:ABC transporter permease n=1 Tax=Roseococcus sp. SYP-B2431 TaxID=2496640 RepID=UPI00103A02A5|nr:ABC transporter permease [Roseococcus sp. SYP-B2431]TCH96855.1 ABC transporter permease [Roseococcus sp. SYP-B2431]
MRPALRTALAAALLSVPLALSSAVPQALAQSQVYDPVPPRGSAYVRLVNGLVGEIQARPDFLPPQRLGTAPEQRVMAFTAVENVAGRQLRLEFQEGQARGSATFRVEPGSFNTILLHPAAGGIGATAVVDTADFNQTRSRIAFYNVLPDCPAATLALLPSGPAVFEGVPALGTRARSVNPVTAQVRASCGARAAAPIALQGLEAGGMYSVWLMGSGSNVAGFVTRDTTARYQR